MPPAPNPNDEKKAHSTAQQRYRKRQKRELEYLHEQVTQMSAHLSALKENHAWETQSTPHWKSVARAQKLASEKASRENARLKRAIEDQLQLAQMLTQLLSKRPRLASFPSIDMANWRLRRLPADATAREECFLAIMADAYDHVDTTLLQRGLLNALHGHRTFKVFPSHCGGSISIDIQYVHELPINFLAASSIFWDVWKDTNGQHIPGIFESNMLEKFGQDTVYMEQFDTFRGTKPYLRRLCGMKRYIEKSRVVIGMRTILEDELYPAPRGLYIGNDAATIVFERKSELVTIRRISLSGELPFEPPPQNPLEENPQNLICDFILHEVTRTGEDTPAVGKGSDDDSSSEGRKTTAQQRYRKRQREELDYLHKQVSQMTAHLDVLKSIRGMETDQSSYWEKKARAQKLGCQKASLENARLKRALEEQLQIAQTLDQLLVKRPKLAAFPTLDMVAWKARQLPMDSAGREASFRAIMADVYERVDTMLLQRGLFDAPHGHKVYRVTTNDTEDAIEIDVQAVHILETNFVTAAMHMWSLWSDPSHKALQNLFRSRVLEQYGDDLIYSEQYETMRETLPYLYRLCIMKRFVEEDRIVFTLRTILNDPKFPTPEGLYVGNDTVTYCHILFVIEHLNENQCIRRLSFRGELPIAPPAGSPLTANSQHLICNFILHEEWNEPTKAETSYLLDLLEGKCLNDAGKTTDEESTPETKVTAQQRYRRKQKEELDYLHEQVAQMAAHLDILKNIRGMEASQSSYWEKKARQQKLGCQKATLENMRLKRALEEQIKVAEALDQLLVKRPKLASFPTIESVDWRLRRLPKDPEGRHAMFNAIMTDAYERADTMLLQQGLFDAPDGHKHFHVKTNAAEDAIEIDIQAVNMMPTDFNTAAARFWSIWSEPNHPSLQCLFHSRVLEQINDDMAYIKQIELLRGSIPYLFRLCVMKRFVEEDRVTFTARTIVEDPLNPPPEGLYIGNDIVTIMIERVSENQCLRRLRVSGQLPIAPPPGNDVWSLDAEPLLELFPAEDCTFETPQQRFRKRQKRELQYLQEQVELLSSHLNVLQNIRGLEANHSSFWEKKARIQILGSKKAVLENIRLKRAIEEQLKVARALNQLLVKRPKLAAFPTMDMVDWKLRRLPRERRLREECFHAIMDDCYERVDTMLMHSGVHDAPDGMRSLDVTSNNDVMSINVKAVKTIPEHFLSAGLRFWSLWNDTTNHLLQGTIQVKVLEYFGNDGVYMEQVESLGDSMPYLRRLGALKRYVEAERSVYVFRTILDDERYPPQPGLYIGNDALVLIIEHVSDTMACRRVCMTGELPIEPPPEGPLASNPRQLICDFTLREVKRTFEALEKLLD
ncbi:hypothetical protein THRCLA_06989 [Thraustotheca clavata]|uniref:Uncharacterized protein n=1 Tax=Thraustotheca clavata TaxID=74557 RepID=A0A1V9ZHM5_9STRA|nr:hypothetical protein THRCLA_06989 [Thraustotheca clavata]